MATPITEQDINLRELACEKLRGHDYVLTLRLQYDLESKDGNTLIEGKPCCSRCGKLRPHDNSRITYLLSGNRCVPIKESEIAPYLR